MTLLRTVFAGGLGLFIWVQPAVAEFIPDDVIISDPSSDLPDPEFDVIDNHVVWQDASGNMWLARLDPATGDMMPPDGRGLLVDTNLRDINDTANGPEWASGDGRPFLAYTRNFQDSYLLGTAYMQPDMSWTFSLLGDSYLRARPEGTAPSHVGVPRIAYNVEDGDETITVGYRDLGDASTEVLVEGEGLLAQGGRWIEGEDTMMVMMTNRLYEFGMVDTGAQSSTFTQATFGNGNKINAFSWFAPEYGEPLLVAMLLKADNHTVGIFRRSKDDPDVWDLFNEFAIPSPDYPYLSSPEAFTANGKSYIVTIAASALGAGGFQFQPSGPSEVWIAGIDPDAPFFRRVDDPSIPFPDNPQRSEPEMYTTAKGPVVFYSELKEVGPLRIRLLRRADTGLGPELGYDFQSRNGPWSSVHRDGRNSGSTPFPIADTYEEASFEAIDNVQATRMVMGPEGNLYMSMLRLDGNQPQAQFRAIDTRDGNREVFTLSNAEVSAGFYAGNALVTENGDFILAGETRISRFTPTGETVWSARVPGVPSGLQFAPDGNVVLFSWNGWFQSIDPESGAFTLQNLATDRDFGTRSASCFQGSGRSGCAYIKAPAIDPEKGVIYTTYTTETDDSQIEAWSYDQGTKGLSRLWTTAPIAGRVSSPVLSDDYTRLYVETGSGSLRALDVGTGASVWTAFLGYTNDFPREPVVNDFGYIMPGGSPNAIETTILRDMGSTFEVKLSNRSLVPLSQPAAGRGNRFVLAARKNGSTVLAVVNPYHGIISETPWQDGPAPGVFTGVTLREDGWAFLGGGDSTTFKAYRPIWPQF